MANLKIIQIIDEDTNDVLGVYDISNMKGEVKDFYGEDGFDSYDEYEYDMLNQGGRYMNKYHSHKRFDEYCDFCGEPTRLYDEMDEWKEFEKDTLTLKICRKCSWEQFRNSKKYFEMKKHFDEKFGRIEEVKESKENEKIEDKSLDKRRGFWYTIIKKLKRR